MRMTDFGNSYMTWIVDPDLTDKRVPGHMPWGNSARILIDARCAITGGGKTEEFYLIAPCRTEWMYRDDTVIQNPSGEYRVIFSQQRSLAVGKSMTESGPAPRSTTNERMKSLVFTIQEFPDVTVLPTDDDVIAATQANLPISAVTELADEANGIRVTLEYPVRTMNINPERHRFQVDTGPLAAPVLEQIASEEHWIDALALAHTIYNRFDRADFVYKRNTPLLRDGKEVALIRHYSEYRAYPAKHTLLAAGRL
jgi:hypothetical protein